MTHQLTHLLTTAQAAKALGIHRRTLHAWLQHKQVAEPEHVVRDGEGNVRYRFFSEQDIERLRQHMARGRKSANAEHVPAGGQKEKVDDNHTGS